MEKEVVELTTGREGTSLPQGESFSAIFQKKVFVTKSLTVLAEAFGYELSDARLEIYLQDLLSLDMAGLSECFERARRRCRFFPTISELLELVHEREREADTLGAEKSWEFVLQVVADWGADRIPLYHAGKFTKPPEFDAPTEYALRQIGGYERVALHDREHIGLIRRDFIAAYCRYRETGELEFPSREEARQLLANVSRQLSRSESALSPRTEKDHAPPALRLGRTQAESASAAPAASAAAEPRPQKERADRKTLQASIPEVELWEFCENLASTQMEHSGLVKQLVKKTVRTLFLKRGLGLEGVDEKAVLRAALSRINGFAGFETVNNLEARKRAVIGSVRNAVVEVALARLKEKGAGEGDLVVTG